MGVRGAAGAPSLQREVSQAPGALGLHRRESFRVAEPPVYSRLKSWQRLWALGAACRLRGGTRKHPAGPLEPRLSLVVVLMLSPPHHVPTQAGNCSQACSGVTWGKGFIASRRALPGQPELSGACVVEVLRALNHCFLIMGAWCAKY